MTGQITQLKRQLAEARAALTVLVRMFEGWDESEFPVYIANDNRQASAYDLTWEEAQRCRAAIQGEPE